MTTSHHHAARRLSGGGVALLILASAGCARGPADPARKIVTPGGGRPVYTAAELAKLPAAQDRAAELGMSPDNVARASFEQPTPVSPALKVFDQWTEQEAAAFALGRIGPPAIPRLVEALGSPDATVRLKAAEVLGRMGQDAAAAAPALTRLLDDPDPQVRKAAIRTLGQIGPAAEEAVPALVQTLLEPVPRRHE